MELRGVHDPLTLGTKHHPFVTPGAYHFLCTPRLTNTEVVSNANTLFVDEDLSPADRATLTVQVGPSPLQGSPAGTVSRDPSASQTARVPQKSSYWSTPKWREKHRTSNANNLNTIKQNRLHLHSVGLEWVTGGGRSATN